MHVKLEDLIRLYQNAQKLTIAKDVEYAVQGMCCCNEGKNPADFATVAEFDEWHGKETASPLFSMPVDELVGHGTSCGNVPNAFTQDFVNLLKNHGATTVIFHADFGMRDSLNEEAQTVELSISAGGFDADCAKSLADNWREGLSEDAVNAIEAADAATLEDAIFAIPATWSWRPESVSGFGWTACESE